MFRNMLPANRSARHLPRLFFSGLFCALLVLLLPGALPAFAAGQPGGNVSDPLVQAVDIARPAVVRIYTSLNSHITVHFSKGGNITFPQDTTRAYPLTLSGSGAFISANGDILTADHVVNPPKDTALDQDLHNQAADDIGKYINQNPQAVGLSQMTRDQVKQALDNDQLPSSASYETPQSEAFLSTDYTGPITASSMDQVPSSIHATIDKIEAQSPVDAKDIAIVHAGFTDTPSIALGDSSTVQTQDTLKVIGFPGSSDINDLPTNLLTATISDINVSSIKTTSAGANVIQVSGNIGPGDSGGPALDTNGHVVGIVDFGTVDQNGSSTGTSFLQVSNSATTILQPLNLNIVPGTFEKLWSQAFASYTATTTGHWHQALQQFQQLSTQYPAFQAVQPYLTYTKTQAQSEKTTQPTATSTVTSRNNSNSATTGGGSSKLPALALTIGGLVLLVLLALTVLVINVRGRGRKKKQKQLGTPSGDPKAPQPDKQGAASTAGPATPSPDTNTPVAQGTLPPAIPPVNSSANTLTLRVWPCGHMNRTTARFCSICGEPAPEPPTSIRPIKP